MSSFPTKLLLSTDGSEEASSATQAAVEISEKISSELHVIHDYGVAPIYSLYPHCSVPPEQSRLLGRLEHGPRRHTAAPRGPGRTYRDPDRSRE
jgi:hypothetical protein